MILFVKPYNNECAIVKAFTKNHKVYIDDAIMVCSDLMTLTIVSMLGKDDSIDMIQYDASVYVQDGFDLRGITSRQVLMYRNKKNFESRVLSEMESVKSFVFRNTQSSEYSFFVDRFSLYQQEKYNICVDILCDVSKYYRIQKRINE